VAKIDNEKCTLCGLCTQLCRFDAISDDFCIDPVSCEGCALCYFACPSEAITMHQKEAGVWFVSDSKGGVMLHARLYPGEENSGKLVSVIRNKAREIAEERGFQLILIDAPAGIGCPVISSITGADEVLVVAEPTVSGEHDMVRMIELALYFGLKIKVCINRFDINEDKTAKIETWCKDRGIKVVGKIPFLKEIPEAQLKGKAPVEENKKIKVLIEQIFESVMEDGQ